MRFRSPTATPVRIALLSGHVTVIGPEWRDDVPPIFHQAAVAAGCQRSDEPAAPEPFVVRGSAAALGSVNDPDLAYRTALITMLGREEDGDFTKDALPNTNAVSKLCGFSARKEDVLRVFQQMKDEEATAKAGEA